MTSLQVRDTLADSLLPRGSCNGNVAETENSNTWERSLEMGGDESWLRLHEILDPGLVCFDCQVSARKLLLKIPFFPL